MILAIDQGTTGTTCIVFDERGRADRACLPRAHPAFPAAGMGGARRQGDMGGNAGGRGRGARRCRSPLRGADGGGHHKPARDRLRMGPVNGRAVAQGDRVARPPHGRALRGAMRSRSRGARARAHGSRARPVLLGHEDRVAAAQCRGAARASASGARCSARSMRGSSSSSRGEHATDQSNASRTMLYDIAPALGPGAAGAAEHPPSERFRGCAPSTGTSRDDTPRGVARPRGAGAQASPATSRPPCSARRAWTRAWARTRTAPARSRCSTQASQHPVRRPVC